VGKVHNRRPEKPESPLATKEAGNESFVKVTFHVALIFTLDVNFLNFVSISLLAHFILALMLQYPGYNFFTFWVFTPHFHPPPKEHWRTSLLGV
jgi:hypothetical protein